MHYEIISDTHYDIILKSKSFFLLDYWKTDFSE